MECVWVRACVPVRARVCVWQVGYTVTASRCHYVLRVAPPPTCPPPPPPHLPFSWCLLPDVIASRCHRVSLALHTSCVLFHLLQGLCHGRLVSLYQFAAFFAAFLKACVTAVTEQVSLYQPCSLLFAAFKACVTAVSRCRCISLVATRLRLLTGRVTAVSRCHCISLVASRLPHSSKLVSLRLAGVAGVSCSLLSALTLSRLLSLRLAGVAVSCSLMSVLTQGLCHSG